MSEKCHGSNGGKATAIIEKEQAKRRIDNYNSNPKVCLFCNTKIIAPYDKPLHETLIKKFCSRSCAAKYNNSHYENKRNPFGLSSSRVDKLTDEDIISAFNNSFSIRDFREKLGYRRESSVISERMNKRLEYLGLDIQEIKNIKIKDISCVTKGELFSTYSGWQVARSAIQKNARKIYEQSDKPKCCICCGYDKHYETAHIKSVSSFDSDALLSEINSIDNLIALCPNHHWEYDNGNLDITPFLEKMD